MIIKETRPGYIHTRKYFDLSDSEKERIKEIFEELRLIFNADSIGLIAPDPALGPKCDYKFKIYNGDSIGYMLDDEIYKEIRKE